MALCSDESRRGNPRIEKLVNSKKQKRRRIQPYFLFRLRPCFPRPYFITRLNLRSLILNYTCWRAGLGAECQIFSFQIPTEKTKVWAFIDLNLVKTVKILDCSTYLQ